MRAFRHIKLWCHTHFPQTLINLEFSLWNISMQEVSNFVNFANTFHPTFKFTCEMSSQCIVFLDTEVFKGPRLTTHKILDLQTHFKPTETFQYTHFSSCHPLNCKKGFIKGEALRLLRTNSVRENFVKNKRDFEHRLCKRGHPLTLLQEILTDVKFTDRKKSSLQQNNANKRDLTICYYLQSGHTESQTDSHETLAHHSTAT